MKVHFQPRFKFLGAALLFILVLSACGTPLAGESWAGISTDGRYIYVNAWTRSEVHKYDVKEGKEVAMVKLDFMPDNLTWTKRGRILAAGVKGARGDCPAGSGTPCIQGFGVAEIEPGKFTAKTIFDSQGNLRKRGLDNNDIWILKSGGSN